MNFTGLFVLSPETDFLPALEVDPAERARMGCTDADFLLTRVGSRSGSKVLDPCMAYALRQFSQPARIVDVVISLSARFGMEPETALDAVLPGLTRLMAEGFVVRADSKPLTRPTLQRGTKLGCSEIVSCLHAMDDSEVHQVRFNDGALGALKISRHGSELGRVNVGNEGRVLERLSGPCVPRLLDRGEYEGRVFIIVEWRRGSNVRVVSSEMLAHGSRQHQHELAALCASIAEAYAWLHEAGVVHGDVHEGNILIDAQGKVTLLDFGIARDMRDPTSMPPRGAAGHGWEPEYATAILAGAEPPPATEAGEQFIVAALLFELLTSVPFTDFSYEAEKALRQIVDDRVRSFAECGAEPWPQMECVLRRALSKGPTDRYPSTRAFADALRHAAQHALDIADKPHRLLERRSRKFDAWVAQLTSFDGDPSAGVARAPRASFAYGAGGVAYTLLRLAQLEDSPRLLAAADLWSEHAMWSSLHDGEEAFGDREMSSRAVGRDSLYFSTPGVHTVRALVGLARADEQALRRAIRALERCEQHQVSPFDLALGLPGLLLACAILLEATPATATASARRLTTLGARIESRIWEAAQTLPNVGCAGPLQSLGMAHGWGGVLYATLRWHQLVDDTMPNGYVQRLEQLAALAQPIGRGARFPWRSDEEQFSDDSGTERYMAGWCNGSAGFVHLWLAAAQALKNDSYRDLAESSAWHTWEDDSEDDVTLCCGFAGRAYALLSWHRQTGEAAWRHRAAELLAAAKAQVGRRTTLDPALLKGHLSLALLERELEHPFFARMPLFEPEGWPMAHGVRRIRRHVE